MIAKLQAMLGMDSSKFNAESKKAGNSVDKVGKGLSKIKGLIAGAFAVGVIVSFGRKLLKLADDMQTTATTFNISMESVIAMKTAMAESGIQTEKFLKILGNLRKSQYEVGRGTATYTDAVKALNMTNAEFISMPVDTLLETMARKYVEAGESADAFGGITTLFGSRIGVTLIEVFKRLGTEGLDPFIEKTKDAAEGMEALAKANDKLEKTGNKVTVWAATFVGWLEKGVDELKLLGEAMTKTAAKKGGLLGIFDVPTVLRESQRMWLKRREEDAEQTGAAETIGALKEEIKAEEKLAKIKDKAARKEQGILAGKGIRAPRETRVSRLQAIGGIVGGVAGAEVQRARIEERQAATQEAIKKLTEETNRLLTENKGEIIKLGEAY